MSVAQSYGTSVEESFATTYERTFVDFVRHIQGQGIPLSDRVMEAAHDRATDRAIAQAKANGYRSMNFAPMAKAGLARARARFGY